MQVKGEGYLGGCEGLEWNHIVQDRDQWWTVATAGMSSHIPYKTGNFLTRSATMDAVDSITPAV